ncbi:MAG: RrF2 family transcriptional regulator [Ruminococcus sp.]
MKISTKGRYAVRLMVDLAQNDNGENISLKDIARRQNLSLKYLEQIITVLTRAGYVISTRGSNGGYRLTHKPEHYTVGMILRLTEGSLAPVSCLDGDMNTCERRENCSTLFVWEELYKAICGVVDKITIADIINKGADNYII